MCLACEMAFWMEVEEAERAATSVKAQPSRADKVLACDAPELPAGDAAAGTSEDGRPT
ncbi:MAG TPA: hypothetical protein VFT69_00955 [Pseudolabrys sp.]|nr:hypothetical protein [Pseudolabrys sp.]